MMSQRSQNAFTKNHTLQKQLEDKYIDLRRSFKHSRRRHDTVEEECLSSLYKLLLYAKEKQDDEDENKNSSESDDKDKDKNKKAKQRPKTALSSKTYTQSYSFAKNGMNIQKAIRDRFMRSKKEKEMSKEPFFKIERLEKRKDSLTQEEEDRPLTTEPTLEDIEYAEPSPRRPTTAHPRSYTSLSRPQVKITLPTSDEAPAAPSQTTIQKMNAAPLEAILNYNTSDTSLTQMAKSISGHGRFLPMKQTSDNGSLTSRPTTSGPNTMSTNSIPSGRKSIAQRSDLFELESTSGRSTIRPESRMCNPGENESRVCNLVEADLIPLNAEEQQHLDTLCAEKPEDLTSNGRCSPRAGSQSVTPRIGHTPTNRNLLKQSSDKTQSFLTQYSKKSKLFGYVVKTRASPVTPRDRVMSFRSPCITYQELSAIKAGIKQQVSMTRSLVQRSAKISIYVDKLAHGNMMRQHIQDMKDARDSIK